MTSKKKRYWSKKNRCIAYVYVFNLGFDSLYKIGWAKNVDRRMKDLSASNPRLRKVLAVKVGHAKRVEYELHEMYQDKSAGRELFRLDRDDLKDIERYLEVNRMHRKQRRICAACGKEFWTAKPHYLCSACAHRAFSEYVCPFCGNPILGKRKGRTTTCQNCASLWGATKEGQSLRCSHVKETGERCKNWAMVGSYYCKAHQR